MVPKEEEMLGLSEDSERLEPSAPPPPAYEDVIAEDEERERKRKLKENSSRPEKPNINLPQEKLIPDKLPQGPWETDKLGELVENHTDAKNTKRKRQRKVKKVMGWSVWVACFPLAVLMNCIREAPQDRNDPLDWNNDPLRPWNYKVNLDTRVH